MIIPRKPHRKQLLSPTPPSPFEAGWSDNDPEPVPPGFAPGTAVCPTCGRALFPPHASMVLDLLVTAQDALGTAHEAIGTLKATVEKTVVP
jgi:hypothetical protein